MSWSFMLSLLYEMLWTTSEVCRMKFKALASERSCSRLLSYMFLSWFVNFWILSSLLFRSLGKDSIHSQKMKRSSLRWLTSLFLIKEIQVRFPLCDHPLLCLLHVFNQELLGRPVLHFGISLSFLHLPKPLCRCWLLLFTPLL